MVLYASRIRILHRCYLLFSIFIFRLSIMHTSQFMDYETIWIAKPMLKKSQWVEMPFNFKVIWC